MLKSRFDPRSHELELELRLEARNWPSLGMTLPIGRSNPQVPCSLMCTSYRVIGSVHTSISSHVLLYSAASRPSSAMAERVHVCSTIAKFDDP